MRPVTLNLGGITDPVVLAALNEIQRASQDTLQNDQSSSGNAMATLVGASADEIAYFTSQYTTAFTALTAFIRTLLAAPDAATARSTLGTGASAGTSPPAGRLTLTSGVAVTTADVSGATTIYYTPATGNIVPIYDGSNYASMVFAELSNVSTDSSTGKAGPAAVAPNSCYFHLVWNDAGTIRLTRSPAWSSDTLVGTGPGTAEIEMVGGFWLNKQDITNGPAAHRGTLVGGFRSNGSSQMVDSAAFRWVSNIYNAVPRKMAIADPTDQWAGVNGGAFRQANGSASNQVDWFMALGGGMIQVSVNSVGSNTTTGKIMVPGIGINRTNGNDADCWCNHNSPTVNAVLPCVASYNGFPGQGRGFAAWLEYDATGGTAAWYGDAGAPGVIQSGMTGAVLN